MVDMAPVSASPQPTPMDLAPGPVMQAADASPPEAATQQAIEEQIAPTPPQEKPDVAAPPEQKQATPPKPEPAKVVPDQKPVPVKPKVTRPEAKKPVDAPPAPRTTAAPRAERQAPAASSASSGASAAAVASYKQNGRGAPAALQAVSVGGEGRGPARHRARQLSRSAAAGRCLSAGLGGSSGHSALDAETLAMVRRAQPFPPFPSDVKQGSMSFSAPVAFYLR